MIGLTPTQAQLLQFIVSRGAQNCPSFQEMMEFMGLRSKSGVHRLITALEERGFIRRLPNRARCIEILPQTENMLRDATTRELVKELQYRGYFVVLRKLSDQRRAA